MQGTTSHSRFSNANHSQRGVSNSAVTTHHDTSTMEADIDADQNFYARGAEDPELFYTDMATTRRRPQAPARTARSAAAPHDRSPQPSVKDLLKKFDQGHEGTRSREPARPTASFAQKARQKPLFGEVNGTEIYGVSEWHRDKPSRIPLMTRTNSNSPPRSPPTYTPSRSPRHNHGCRIPTPTNGSLSAYISTPPPKLSPPLRSSRPRVPVSAATTASSRARQKKVDIGPVDFAARRERIVRQYTKSIHETKEAERRREEIQRMQVKANSIRKELEPDTAAAPADTARDSPTLGMPGAFPEPASPSNDSATTEIDNEPQLEPPIEERGLGLYVEDRVPIQIALDTLASDFYALPAVHYDPDEPPSVTKQITSEPSPESREEPLSYKPQDSYRPEPLEPEIFYQTRKQPETYEPLKSHRAPELYHPPEALYAPASEEPHPPLKPDFYQPQDPIDRKADVTESQNDTHQSDNAVFVPDYEPDQSIDNKIDLAEAIQELRDESCSDSESMPTDLHTQSDTSVRDSSIEDARRSQSLDSMPHASQDSIDARHPWDPPQRSWADTQDSARHSWTDRDASIHSQPIWTIDERESLTDSTHSQPWMDSVALDDGPRLPVFAFESAAPSPQMSEKPSKAPSISSTSSAPYWSDHAPPPIPNGYVEPSVEPFVESVEPVAPQPETEEAKAEKKRLFKRGNIIGELIDTESSYLKDMHVVVEIYKGTAEACPKLETDDVRAIFRNMDHVVAFTTTFVEALRKAASIYAPSKKRLKGNTGGKVLLAGGAELTDAQDRETTVGQAFMNHLKQMETVYADFLKNSENANTRLQTLSSDPAVRVWLDECIQAAQDLTNAWSLDALLVKPVQRITRYQLLLKDILGCTPVDHPDRQPLSEAHDGIIELLKNIDELKKRIHTVEKIVTRKRKESDVRAGLAKLVSRQARKPERSNDDPIYLKLHERYSDDFLRLQVVLRDVEYYTRRTSEFVKDWLRFLSAIEQMVRFKQSGFPELESKWVRFNMSMRDMESVALDSHLVAVRKQVIEPFETMIKSYGPPAVAMNKRQKRRLDFEKANHLKSQGKKIDDKLAELVEQYDALNETLKLELPKLSKMTETVANLCLVQFVNLQTNWWGIWVEKVKAVLENHIPGGADEIVEAFHREFRFGEAKIQELGIINGSFRAGLTPRTSAADTRRSSEDRRLSRARESSVTSDVSPSLPTPDFLRSHNFTLPHLNSQDGSTSPAVDWYRQGYRSTMSADSDLGTPRESLDSHARSQHSASYQETRPFSGLFSSAMPPDDSRTSSRDREPSRSYNVLYLAASLFEFNMEDTKTEAGYPYLTYQPGEIFDVIGEKGELWLAKNQDDPGDAVGWIWSKHFARLAD